MPEQVLCYILVFIEFLNFAMLLNTKNGLDKIYENNKAIKMGELQIKIVEMSLFLFLIGKIQNNFTILIRSTNFHRIVDYHWLDVKRFNHQNIHIKISIIDREVKARSIPNY